MEEVPRRGRPRSQATHAAILDAVREVLVSGGYAEVSMDRIAARAGVGKQSLYRRWASKAPLVAEAVMDAYGQGPSFDLPDTRDLATDLQTWLRRQAAYLASEHNVALSRALVVATADDPSDGKALYDQLSRPHHDALLVRLRNAAAAGEVRHDADLNAAAEALIGATLYRIVSQLRTYEETVEHLQGLVDVLLRGLRP
ncbi:TetR/AcrR family transcriptional regulator [Mycolicibacterium sp. GCM10028919]|uniref:TetR/AcrR family transcriptional regulator n=1 Tax=Mycolicibacterium sp. GCM10028919 TaxID=3273401 RepID=UPI003616B351